MPLIDRDGNERPDHLRYIFATTEQVTVGRGELERLRCIEREVSFLRNQIGPHPLETVLLRGDVLEHAFELL